MSHNKEEILSQLETIQDTKDKNLDIAEIALLLASLDLPNKTLEPYRSHLNNISHDLSSAAQGARKLSDLVRILSDVFYGLYGYSGDAKTFNDMQNANIIRVIDRKKGLPVALGILLIHVSRAQSWNITGVNFPGYFLLRFTHEGEQVLVDPFNKAKTLTVDDLNNLSASIHGKGGRLRPGYLKSVTDRDVLLRLQNNIKTRALKSGDPARAFEVIERMHRIAPDNANIVSEMAVLDANNGNIKRSLSYLSEFLLQWKEHPSESQINALLDSLKRRLN